jgi:teichuronic acid exporter
MSTEQHKLDQAFVGGLAWTAAAKWITQAVTWVGVLFSARLLSPQDFGAVELASFASLLTNILAEFGIGATVLQMRELDRKTLAQLNSVSLMFSTVAFALSTALTPLIAQFFRTKQLIPLMLVTNLGYFITGFQAVPMGLVERDMDYRRLSMAESLQALVQAAVTVGCAFAGMGYWSLLAGPMAGKGLAAGLIIYWKPLPFAIPRRDEVVAPMRFGLQIAVSRLAWAAYSQSDAIIIGRVLGQTALGTYRLAMNIASAPAEKVGMLIMRVTGPLFSRVQKDESLVKRYFLFISDGLALIIFPLAFGLVVVAPDVVTVVLGPQWKSAIVPMQWLAAYMAFRTLNSLMTQVLISLRFASYSMWMSLFTSAVMVIAFLIAAPHGASAVAMMWLLMSPIVLLPPALKLFGVLHCTFWEYLRLLSPATLASLAVALAAISVKRWLIPNHASAVWSLVSQIAAGGLVYAAVLMIFYRPLVMRYVRFAIRMRSKGDLEPVTDLP